MKKALIVVDYQVDFVSGTLGFEVAESLDFEICEKIIKIKHCGGDLIFTLDTHYENYLDTAEGKFLPITHCIKGSEGHGIYGKTAEHISAADKIFEKNTFGSLELGEYLRQKKYDEVELCGLISNICVLSNAIIARSALPEATIKISSTLSSLPEIHNQALNVLTQMGFEI